MSSKLRHLVPITLVAAMIAVAVLAPWDVIGRGRRRARHPRPRCRRAARTARDRGRGAGRRLLLGRAGRLPARRGRHAAPSPAMRAAKRTRRTTRWSAPARPATRNRCRSPSTRARSATASILQIYFSVAHDPTQLNRQGPDVGTQYRSAIFPTNAGAGARRQGLHRAARPGACLRRRRSSPRSSPTESFYPAEDYHQDFLTLQPDLPVHRDQRPAEGRQPEADLPGHSTASEPVLVMAGKASN